MGKPLLTGILACNWVIVFECVCAGARVGSGMEDRVLAFAIVCACVHARVFVPVPVPVRLPTDMFRMNVSVHADVFHMNASQDLCPAS